jgi:hypothetical protein
MLVPVKIRLEALFGIMYPSLALSTGTGHSTHPLAKLYMPLEGSFKPILQL